MPFWPYWNPDACVLLRSIEVLKGCWLAWLEHLGTYVNDLIGSLVNWEYLDVICYFCLVSQHVLRPQSQYFSIALHFTLQYKELSAEVEFAMSWVFSKIIVLVQVDPCQGLHVTSKLYAYELVTLATILINRSLGNYQLDALIWSDYLAVLGNLRTCSVDLNDFYWLFSQVPNSIKWRELGFFLLMG